MKSLLFAMSLLSLNVSAKTLTIAVIDTGFDMSSTWTNAKANKLAKPKICKFGHYDFVENTTTITDKHGHGTHIAGLIAQGNEDIGYCLVIMNYYSPKKDADNMASLLRAYRRAIDIKVDVINMSGGGTEYSEKECSLIKEALDSNIEVVAAAGNEKSDLDDKPFYPALCDPRVKVVMNVYKDGTRVPSSNYSTEKYDLYNMLGSNIMSLAPNNSYALMTGTSQATAQLTSKIVNKLSKYKTPTETKRCTFNYVGVMICSVNKGIVKKLLNLEEYR